MMFLISWYSKEPTATTEKYVKTGHGLDASVKVLHDLHTIGSPSGFMLVETDKPELLNKAAISWGSCLECSIIPVISGDQAKSSFSY